MLNLFTLFTTQEDRSFDLLVEDGGVFRVSVFAPVTIGVLAPGNFDLVTRDGRVLACAATFSGVPPANMFPLFGFSGAGPGPDGTINVCRLSGGIVTIGLPSGT